MHEEDMSTVHRCQNWFTKFPFDNFDIEDVPCSRRSVELDADKVKGLTDTSRGKTIRKIIVRNHISNLTVRINVFIHYKKKKKMVFNFDQPIEFT